jgi:triosephosphate isomerase
MSRKMLIAGNWKMNGSAVQVDEFAQALTAASDLHAELAICVPLVYSERMARALAACPVALGAQNLADQVEPGALTGEVNGAMLRDVGCEYVIVGHSERRARYGESNDVVAVKVRAAITAGLKPIVCCGETLDEREADRTEAVLATQIEAVLSACGDAELACLTVAYEPVWAIGTGRSATPEQAQDAHAFVRAQLAARSEAVANATRLLYGGSVKPDNAAALFAGADIDGALVGGASLEAASFLDIARAAQ